MIGDGLTFSGNPTNLKIARVLIFVRAGAIVVTLPLLIGAFATQSSFLLGTALFLVVFSRWVSVPMYAVAARTSIRQVPSNWRLKRWLDSFADREHRFSREGRYRLAIALGVAVILTTAAGLLWARLFGIGFLLAIVYPQIGVALVRPPTIYVPAPVPNFTDD